MHIRLFLRISSLTFYANIPGKTWRFLPLTKGKDGGFTNLLDCDINLNNSHGFLSDADAPPSLSLVAASCLRYCFDVNVGFWEKSWGLVNALTSEQLVCAWRHTESNAKIQMKLLSIIAMWLLLFLQLWIWGRDNIIYLAKFYSCYLSSLLD